MPRDDWDETNPDKQAILKIIHKHQTEVRRLKKLKDYYEGAHKILQDEGRENKLVCNHAKDISDTASSYFIGNPVSYKAEPDITPLTDALENAGADEADGDNGLNLSIYGRAYEYVYPEEGRYTTTQSSSGSCSTSTIIQKRMIAINGLLSIWQRS